MSTSASAKAQFVTKDPQAKKDYGTDWSDRLVEGELIIASTWSLESSDWSGDGPDPAPIEFYNDTNDGKVATVWLRKGTAGVTYVLVNHIITNQAREDDREKFVTVYDH